MIDECPTCARQFKNLEDYPFIYLKKFERLEIPNGLVFPYKDYDIYVDDISNLTNDRVPIEVKEFFKNNQNAKDFEFDDWNWNLSKGKENCYRRSQNDQRPIILKHLNNYFDTMERYIKKEVPTAHFLPPFSRNDYFKFAFDILETNYQFNISENKDGLEKIDGKIRKADLEILGEGINLGSAGGPTLQNFVTIAKIEYEGRLLK